MRKGFILAISIMVMLVMVWVGFGCAPKAAPVIAPRYADWPEKEIHLNFSTTSSASSHYLWATRAAKIINENVPNVVVTVMESGGVHDNIGRVDRGEADFGMNTASAAIMSYSGELKYEGKQMPWMNWGPVYYLSYGYMVVRADSGITTLQGLEGKKFNPGLRGGTWEYNTTQVLGALDIHPDYYHASTSDAVAAIKDRRIVGYGKTSAGRGKLDASMMDIKAFTPIHIIDFGEENVKILSEKHPYMPYLKIPANTPWEGYPSFWTYGDAICVFFGPDFPEELAYQITKALCTHVAEQQEVFMIEDDMVKASIVSFEGLPKPVPLHPGAYKYYKEAGYKVPKGLIPPK